MRAFQTEQQGLSNLLLRAIASVFGTASQNDRIAAEVNRFAQVSTLNASEWYGEMRDLAGARGRFDVNLLSPPPDEKIAKSLQWAQRGEDPDAVRTKVEGVVQKLVTDVGRDTITDAIDEDDEAWGFARYARPGSCYFCALMASRGVVYGSEASAGRRANERFKGEGTAKFHDHCHCTIVPVFAGQDYEMPAHIAKADQIYRDSTGHVSGADKLREFRKAYEQS